MALLLRQAFLPNITQTLEEISLHSQRTFRQHRSQGTRASSPIEWRWQQRLVVLKPVFSSDMGAEKFMHIKAAMSGKAPDCVVMNATVRSMKLHGGAFGDRGGIRPDKAALEAENVEATSMGAKTNLDRHIRNARRLAYPWSFPSIGLLPIPTQNWPPSPRRLTKAEQVQCASPRFTPRAVRAEKTSPRPW